MIKKKIVVLINSLGMGGAERVIVTLLNELVNDYNCYLILIENEIYYELDDRITIIHLNENSNSNGMIKLLRLPILSFKLSNIIKEHKFTNILSLLTRSNYLNVLSNLFQKHETILSEHSLLSMQYANKDLKSIINKSLVHLLYKYADNIITVSKYCKYDLKVNFNVINNVHTIYNPIDIELIRNKKNDDIDIEFKKFTFVTIGRLDEGKNHKLMIDSIKDIDANLIIIGDGILRNELEIYIDKLNLNNKILLLGLQLNPFKYLSKSDAFIFTTNFESFGMVLLEALACDLPIISTDCLSGPREILAPNSDIKFKLKDKLELANYGILTPINNSNKLKEAMNLIINDENLRKNYKEKASQRVNEFSVNQIVEQYKKILGIKE